jgi:hypothetical protein
MPMEVMNLADSIQARLTELTGQLKVFYCDEPNGDYEPIRVLSYVDATEEFDVDFFFFETGRVFIEGLRRGVFDSKMIPPHSMSTDQSLVEILQFLELDVST